MSYKKSPINKVNNKGEYRNFILNKVGKGGVNNKQDIKVIISLLKQRKLDPFYKSKLSRLTVPSVTSDNLRSDISVAISSFQVMVQGRSKADGVVSPNGNTILFLGGVRKQGKMIIVDQNTQNLYAYDNGKKIFDYHCATGDKENPTSIKPEVHHIMRKHKIYRSRAYDAQMNYAMFFTYDGKAIHQSSAVNITSYLKMFGLNSLGSKGCVRLEEENAKEIFDWAPMNTLVFVDMA